MVKLSANLSAKKNVLDNDGIASVCHTNLGNMFLDHAQTHTTYTTYIFID
jgi:hypothetical protein